MKILPSSDGKFAFQFSEHERELFLATLNFYPLLNPDYHKISKGKEEKINAGQELLREAMKERQDENRKQLADLVHNLQWKASGPIFELSTTSGEINHLLELLNDVRVGAWDILGRPDQKQRPDFSPDDPLARYVAAMDLSGFFQTVFLNALQGKQ
jgi:hypothetical protein